MKAKFIGKNGSLGLENGKVYQIVALPSYSWYPILLLIENKKRCGYRSLETMLQNWELIN